MRQRSLFGRLLCCFVIVMLLPVGVLFLSYRIWGVRSLARSLENEAALATRQYARDIAVSLDSYRHDVYLISTDSAAVNLLSRDPATVTEEDEHAFYTRWNASLHTNPNTATIHLVSTKGYTLSSTAGWSSASLPALPLAEELDGQNQRASLISLGGRRTGEQGEPIIVTIVRRVYDDTGANLGYVVLEVSESAIDDLIAPKDLLTELLLVDPGTSFVRSLTHPASAGPMERFPLLDRFRTEKDTLYVEGSSVVSVVPLPGTDLELAGFLSGVPYRAHTRHLRQMFAIALSIGLALAVLLAWLFARTISRPVQDLAKAMKDVEDGNLRTKPETKGIRELSQLDHSFNVMVGKTQRLLDLTREKETKLAEAERKALESQMNPHFLFNTLNTIKALARMHHEDQIYQITLKLGRLLRYTVDNHESSSTIKESMDLVDSYLTIQQIRFGEKLHVSKDVSPETLDCLTPKLIIQPMVENAIGHGLEPKAGDWHLSLSITIVADRLRIVVADDGVGFDRSSLPADLDRLDGSGHVGIYNAYRRLKLAFGDEATFVLDSTPGSGTTVTITLPVVRQSPEPDESC